MLTQRILVMGLPGSGKTYFAERLKKYLEIYGEKSLGTIDSDKPFPNLRPTVTWFNADDVRRKFNDWDFSKEGRIRQSIRMFEFALAAQTDYVICDFVAPLVEMRNNFKADWTIWMDTIDQGRYEDTNRAFVPPEVYDFRITEQNAERWAEFVGEHILEGRRRPRFDPRRETVQMLGRWQPWHAGHRALFERAIVKTGQVSVMVRDCQGWQGTNPFNFDEIRARIERDLDPLYQGQYEVRLVPNIVNITYGRAVGYTIEQEVLDDETQSISGTAIRRAMGLA